MESLTYTGRVTRLSADQRAALSDWIAAEVPQTTRAVRGLVRSRFGVSYAAHAMAQFGQIGFVLKTHTCVLAKADTGIRQTFLDTTLAPRKRPGRRRRSTSWTGATPPIQGGPPTAGSGAARPSDYGRTRINIDGALSCLERTLVHREAEKITSTGMIRLSTDFEARHPEAAGIALVLDNARYDRSTGPEAASASSTRRPTSPTSI